MHSFPTQKLLMSCRKLVLRREQMQMENLLNKCNISDNRRSIVNFFRNLDLCQLQQGKPGLTLSLVKFSTVKPKVKDQTIASKSQIFFSLKFCPWPSASIQAESVRRITSVRKSYTRTYGILRRLFALLVRVKAFTKWSKCAIVWVSASLKCWENFCVNNRHQNSVKNLRK